MKTTTMKTTTKQAKPTPRHAPDRINYAFQPETVTALQHLNDTCPGTVAQRDMEHGANNAEPLLVMLDSLVRMAKAYRARFDGPIAEDYVAKPEFAAMLAGARAMLNFDGVLSWERDAEEPDNRRHHDSKDNGTLESLYCTACELAGLDSNNI